MDITTTLKEIETWSIDDQVELVHRLWDRLLDAGWRPELTDTLSAELERRLDDADNHPVNVVTWEEIVAHVRRKK